MHYQIVNYKNKLQNQSTAGSIEVTDCKMIQSLFELTAYIANAVNTINGEKSSSALFGHLGCTSKWLYLILTPRETM